MEKRHYYLVCASVLYVKDGIERSRSYNTVVTSAEQNVVLAQIGRVQQVLQARFFQEYNQEGKLTVVDVYIQSMSYVGLQTAKEFYGDQYVNPEAETETAANDAE